MMSAEEIINKHFDTDMLKYYPNLKEAILSAMKEYASQSSTPAGEDVDRVKELETALRAVLPLAKQLCTKCLPGDMDLSGYDLAEKALRQPLAALQNKVPVECYEIEFAEWIYRDFYPYRNSLDTFTYQWVRRSGGGILYTAEELFKKFCEEKKTTLTTIK